MEQFSHVSVSLDKVLVLWNALHDLTGEYFQTPLTENAVRVTWFLPAPHPFICISLTVSVGPLETG